MAPTTPRLRILSVGGNAVSAFLSWRLQATNACDVTLVWKSGFDAVHQYGISFKSKLFGNERFKPRHVVRTPEDASGQVGAFDYVLLCVKALPDVYDLAAVIETVVTPQHTCILVNTTHTLGVETHLEQRFPTNVVLSLVSGAEITQLGASEFEHRGSTDVWVGPANPNPSIPAAIQSDMAEALAMTLNSGQVNCQVSENIRQQQYQRMIGPIAFHPTSVLFETPTHSELMEKTGVRPMISDIIDELICIAAAQDCHFPPDFKQKTIEGMLQPTESSSIMFQDFTAKRPMEVETYLGSPIKIASQTNVRVPRIETLYALLHHLNIVNQTRPVVPASSSPTQIAPQRLSSAPVAGRPPVPMGNGAGPRMSRGPPNGVGPPGMRRGPGPPGPNGFPPRGPSMMNGGHPPRGGYNGGQPSRRGSFEANDLEEFSHLVHYDDIPEGDITNGGYPDMAALALREKELMLRERELALRNQEYGMRRGGPGRRPPPPASHRGGYDDDDDDDFYEPSVRGGPPPPQIDPDSFDMMSVTSRRTRKAPSASQLRKNPEGSSPMRSSGAFGGFRARNRTSSRMVGDVPGMHESIMDNPMMQYSSNRYGTVDRMQIGDESRTNSLTAAKLDELQGGGGQIGPYPTPANPRRTSQSPGNPYGGPPAGPPGRHRPSPPNGAPQQANGYGPPPPGYGGRPSPPHGMRQPVPRYPPGQGNSVAPQQVEQHAGVSKHHTLLHPHPPPPPPKGGGSSGNAVRPNVRSLTGSASASAGSGDSSGAIDSTDTSAYSSQDSLGVTRGAPPTGLRVGSAPIGVR